MKLHHLSMQRFFEHFKDCGGCAGLKRHSCGFSIRCEFVEKWAKEGVVTSSMDFGFTVDGDYVDGLHIEQKVKRGINVT